MLHFLFTRRTMAVLVALMFLLGAFASNGARDVQAISPDIVISQVYGGGGNTGAPYQNDFVELFNRGTTNASLSGWSVQYASATGAGNFASNPLALLSGTLAPGQYYLVKLAGGATGAALPASDATGTVNMSGTSGKVALVNQSTGLACNGGSTPCSAAQLATIVDLVGYGSANFFEGSGVAPALSNSTAALRAANGCTETDNNSSDFAAGSPAPRNTASPLGPCSTGINLTINDVSLNEGNSGTTSFDFTVSLSAPAGAGGVTFDIATQDNSATTADNDYQTNALTGQTIAQGNSTYTFSVLVNGDAAAESDETFFVNVTNVTGATVGDGQGQGTIVNDDTCGLPATFIHDIQGSGLSSPMNGTTGVTIEGIVVGDYQGTGQFGGYHVQEQDSDADADPATSEGIFVFNTAFPVSVGDKVRVIGNVFEFTSSGITLTELTSVTNVVVCSTGNSVTPTSINFPVAAVSDLEAYEGMLVTFPQQLTVSETFTLGRFGEVVLSADGRLMIPTHVTTPGAPALAVQDENNRRRITLDDGNNQQNIDPTIYPAGGLSAFNTLRSGYTVNNLTGVLEQRFGVYRVQPVGAVNFNADNPRPDTPEAVSGTVKVVAANVLNYFNGDGLGGGFPTARGANTPAEFQRQRDKIINALAAMNGDVVGLMEIENDATPNSAIEDLVAGLNNTMGAGTYDFINTGIVGTDAIRVALIYKPATVTPAGNFAILNTAVDPRFIDTKNRPALAQTFTQNATGAKFTVVVNHLKSKGSDCNDVGDPDTGDGQGNCNLTRTKAAEALIDWIASDPTASGDADAIIIGDLNSYAREDPITTLENGGYLNLIADLIGGDAYSYVFGAQSGYLDHALANASLAPQVTGVAEWHINADEPVALDYNVEFKTANQINTFYDPGAFRASDHDPIIVGLDLDAPPVADTNGPYDVDEGGSVTLNASATDPNGGTLTFEWDLDFDGTFETSGQSVSFSAAGRDGPSEQKVKVRVTDDTNLSDTAQTKVIIHNVAPSVDTPTVSPEPSTKSQAAAASATFSDPADALDEPYTCTVDYGDGSGAQPGTVNGNTCTGDAHTYANVGAYTVTVTVTDKDNETGTNSATHNVVFAFNGFFAPVDNLPTLNVVKAGSSVPIKFSLGGDQGLVIIATGYPKAQAIGCDSNAPTDGIEETVTAGGSELTYDAATDTYTYVWKTKKAWAGTCRQFVIEFTDGTNHRANFKFK